MLRGHGESSRDRICRLVKGLGGAFQTERTGGEEEGETGSLISQTAAVNMFKTSLIKICRKWTVDALKDSVLVVELGLGLKATL